MKKKILLKELRQKLVELFGFKHEYLIFMKSTNKQMKIFWSVGGGVTLVMKLGPLISKLKRQC